MAMSDEVNRSFGRIAAMKIRAACISAVVLCGLIAATAPSPNDAVIRAARSYADGGVYSLKWGGTGCPEEVTFKGERILGKGTEGTYCCGFTFAVAMKAAGEIGLLKDKSVDEVRQLQKEWYGAVKDQETREKQCAVAVAHLGIGQTVSPADAQPGDFMQLWRTTKTGHSVVFLEWVIKDGKPIGFTYRSSQESTKGIGDKTEYFSDVPGKRGKVLRERIYFGRFNSLEPVTK
jgi:hypothetical protein